MKPISEMDTKTASLFDQTDMPALSVSHVGLQDSNSSLKDELIEPQQWRRDLLGAYRRFMASPSANGGKGFTEESRKVYGAMLSKFCRFSLSFSVNPAEANEHLIGLFIEFLERQHIQKVNIKVHGSQVSRGSDAGGAKRQIRRYLQVLAKVMDVLVVHGVRDESEGNPARTLLNRLPAEPDRPIPSALIPVNECQLQRDLAISRVVSEVNQTWRGLRDTAICELISGSGLTSRQIRELLTQDVQQGLSDSPPWIYPSPARPNQRIVAKVPLTDSALSVLRKWIEFREDHIPGVVLFPGTMGGETMSQASVYRAVREHLAKAQSSTQHNLPNHLGPRTLRHTFAVRQLRAGKPLPVLQQWLGHSKPSSTSIYEKAVLDPNGFRPD